jgi:thiamine pyrophosphate-dependent acetolactate synthase large subunit-like protein
MMTHREALEVLAPLRGGRAVVSTMGSVAFWPKLSDTPLDFAYNPSSMGQGIALGLGMALAKPGRGVVVLMGDGSMLMNLGSLVTVAQHAVDLYVLLIDNGLYEVTGGQPVAGAGRTDFARLARAAGIARVYTCGTLEEWRATAPEALSGAGPVFVWLRVRGELGQQTPAPPRPMTQQVARLRAALGNST